MKNLSVKFGLAAAGIYMLIELLLIAFGISHDRDVMIYTLGANSLLLLLGVALSILVHFNRNKKGGLSMIVDLKMGITAAAVYAIIVSCFLFLYFTVIDPSYPEMRKQQWVEMMQEKAAIEDLQNQMSESPMNYTGKSVEDVQEMNISNVEHMLSAKTIFPISLFSLLLLGMIYSFFITAFNRLVLSKL